MKTILLSSVVLLCLAASTPGQVPPVGPPPTESPGAPGGSTNDLASASVSTNPVVVATPSPPVDPTVIREIRPVPGGAVADFAAHTVTFALNANTAGAIQVQLPQPFVSQPAVVLSSHVLGLCYWAISGANAGQSAMIASLTDSTGQILPPTTVCYPDALGPGFDAIYNYSESAIEQNIIIKGQLPPPASILPATTEERDVMLVVITEFVNPAEPRHSMVTVDLSQINQQLGVDGPPAMAGEALLFGPMRILGAAQALVIGSQPGSAVPTVTTWIREASADGFGGRCFVVDSVPYPLVKAQLAALPAGQGKGHGMFKPAPDLKTMLASIPRPSPADNSSFVIRHSSFSSPAPAPMSLAKAGTRPAPGLMIDYILSLGNLLNINFAGALSTKVGPAQVGQNPNDFWNPVNVTNSAPAVVTDLFWADGTASRVGITVPNAQADWADGVADPMMSTYVYNWMANISVILTNLPSATYDFYLYGHGPTTDNSIFYLGCGQSTNGPLSTCVTNWNTLPSWVQDDEYVLFRGIPVSSNLPVFITVVPDSLGWSLICGLQATLNGDATNPCTPPATGLVAWWRGEGNASDQQGVNNGVWQGTPAYSYGEVDRAFSFDGTTDIRVPASASLNVGAGPGLTMEAWIKPAYFELSPQALLQWDSATNYWGTGMWLPGYLALYAVFMDPGWNGRGIGTANWSLFPGVWQHVAATYDTNSGVGELYINGQLCASNYLNKFAQPTTAGDLYIASSLTSTRPNYVGLMDEAAIYSRALTGPEIYGIYAAGAAGKCTASALTITNQPQSQVVLQGANAAFTVAATSTAPVTYQWTFNGMNLAGATNSTLVLTNVQAQQQGLYAVVVSNNSSNYTTSANATLSLDNSLRIWLTEPPPGSNVP